MRPLHDTVVRWEATFVGNSSISELRAAVKDRANQNPCDDGLRSICWKAFLLFENLDKSTWKKTLGDSRSAYSSLKDHFLRDLEHPDDLSATDPLTDDQNSPWYVLRQDEELRGEIYQDVDRCMPDNSYFREPSTQAILVNILFIFCKLNRDVGYRQGMHEVLALIVWVVSRDSIDPTTLGDLENHMELGDLIPLCFDAAYVEHDAFTLFCILMQTVKSFYEVGSSDPMTSSTTSSSSPIVERSKRIHEQLLRQADLELAEHLSAIEVLPQIFLIRWIRLLFGREFAFDDVLSLWDVLFAEDPTLDLVDLICVSMLLRIRWQLIEADYSEALTLLLRYPAPPHPCGPSSFIGDALYLREHLQVGGGVHIIFKYSNKLPLPPLEASVNAKSNFRIFSKKGRRRKPQDHNHSSKTASPRVSPAKFFQEQGGVEGILQEAARGLYSRGEKWGVTKALRGAVQGLQSGSSSPRNPTEGSRGALKDGKITSDESSTLTTRIRVLEQRNQALAKMLQHAVEDLWIQQNKLHEAEAKSAADGVSLAVAKVQFVQVYLENSSMPFPAEDTIAEATKTTSSSSTAQNEADRKSDESSRPLSGTSESESSHHSTDSQIPTSPSPKNMSKPPNNQIIPIRIQPADTDPMLAQDHQTPHRPGPSPFHRPRASLTHSSFSWMLGEDQRQSSFVSASPFPSEKRIARGKAGFLFGDDKDDGGKHSGKPKGQSDKESEDETITLDYLKGPTGMAD